VFALNAASYALSAALTWSVRARFADPDRTVEQAEEHRGVSAGWRFILADRVLRQMMIAWFVFLIGMATTIVADPVLIPEAHRANYQEKIVRLPHSYLPHDEASRAISERRFERSEFGLPECGFVFCCFNNNYKITARMFDVWMRLLQGAPGSVLWLLRENAGAEANLRREAQVRGVDPGRLVFAGRLKVDQHLARHRLADLFLDTLPYNAHTTASDALWAGLPVLTCQGEAFAARVASSLLTAVGLPQLVTTNLADYEALAVALAQDAHRLGDIRAKLAHNRATEPLFDTDRFRQYLEAAYLRMWDICQRGEAPRSFAVEKQA
jgi:predicted O-linked N-acetylglucosamine transferase (SPINDLY family)